MPVTVVVGCQWGDEAKGKVVHRFSKEADLVVRCSGGANAGHTVYVDGRKFKVHIVPSGILNGVKNCVIAGGVVVDPRKLLQEIESLSAAGVDVSRLVVSETCHVVTSEHKERDIAQEFARADTKIGTTGQGIGPAYSDKAARTGRRICDSLDWDECVQKLRPWVGDTTSVIRDALLAGKQILVEGAQGALLDNDYGEYPFVTSSHPVAASACLGTGIGPREITRVVGVVKAYSTRVGAGTLPTELSGDLADRIRLAGNEFGTTTGRPRRVGWLDLPALRYSMSINSVDVISLMLLDVLGDMGELAVCHEYEYPNGERERYFNPTKVARAKPVYRHLAGWSGTIGGARRLSDLPVTARKYVDFVQEELGVPVGFISVGTASDQMWEV